MNLVLLGPPGAGKGSLAGTLKNSLGVAHISTGDILREEIKGKTALGLQAQKFIESGQLVPDEFVTKLIENRFKTDGLKKGYMLDGFPRTTQQAEDLDGILKNVNKPLDYALDMEASLPIIITRLCGRRVCRQCGHLYHLKNKPPKAAGTCDACGGELYQRSDDNEETIRKRMDVYIKSTAPITDYYKKKNILMKLNGDQETIEIHDILIKKFDENRKSDQH